MNILNGGAEGLLSGESGVDYHCWHVGMGWECRYWQHEQAVYARFMDKWAKMYGDACDHKGTWTYDNGCMNP